MSRTTEGVVGGEHGFSGGAGDGGAADGVADGGGSPVRDSDHGGGGRRGVAGDAELSDWLGLVPAAGGLLLLAPLEYATGRGLGLGPEHAATITVTLEGFTAYALAKGRLAWLGIGLSTASAGVGLYAALVGKATAEGQPVTWQEVVIAAVITALAGVALGGTHHIRSRTARERSEAAERAAALAHARAVEERAAAARLEAERAAREEEAAAADHERQRELARDARYAEQDRAMAEQRARELELQAERVRAEAERERATAEQNRAEGERFRAETERAAAERERVAGDARARSERAEREREDRARADREAAELRAAAERTAEEDARKIRTSRRYARERWLDERWPAAELALRRGVSEGRARADIAEWSRSEESERVGS